MFLALASSVAFAQPAERPGSPPRPIAESFGSPPGVRIDRARIEAEGYREQSAHGGGLWTRTRTGSFFDYVEIALGTEDRILSVNALATLSRPAGSSDSPARREALLASCQAARAALGEIWLMGMQAIEVSPRITLYVERSNAEGNGAAPGALSVRLSCSEIRQLGQVQLGALMTRTE